MSVLVSFDFFLNFIVTHRVQLGFSLLGVCVCVCVWTVGGGVVVAFKLSVQLL